MRLVKVFLAGAIGLFIVMTLLSLLIPSKVKVSRTVLINNTSKTKVFEQVATLPNWKNWHPVFKSGDTKIIFSSPDVKMASYAEILYGAKSAKITITQADSTLIKFTLQSPGETDIAEIGDNPFPYIFLGPRPFFARIFADRHDKSIV